MMSNTNANLCLHCMSVVTNQTQLFKTINVLFVQKKKKTRLCAWHKLLLTMSIVKYRPEMK